ncbi:MAG TPA: RecX family transcriptional regulator, partial [Thermoanaerobaculia bacterium]|nr:RecX family transcriptional regulator [Thermoanaerobaculia bacterium]
MARRASDRPSAYDQAVKLLARRTHFRREIEAKLGERGYPPAEVEEALARLSERRYLDDAEAARQFVAGKLGRGAFGRARLLAELDARGVERGISAAVLDEALPEDDLPAAREEARRHPGKAPAAVARRLERRGFSARAI